MFDSPLPFQPVCEQKIHENYSDASDEMMLDDSETVRYKVGGSFVEIPKEEAEEMLEAETATLKAKVEALTTERSEIKSTLADLKAQLYAKFGSSINLD